MPLAEMEREGLSETKQRLVVSILERLQAVRLVDRDGEFLYLEPGHRRPQPAEVQSALREAENRLVHRRGKLSFIMNWANTTRCRREMLLWYFGEKPEGKAAPCCDNCEAAAAGGREVSLEPLAVLACVAGLPRGLGRKKLVDILRGVTPADISARGRELQAKLPGLSGRSGKHVLEIIDRLLGDGYLALDGLDYPVVVLTAAGRQALQRGEPLPAGPAGKAKEAAGLKAGPGSQAPLIDQAEEGLLQALKEYRSSLARQEQKPAYVFFHDSVLREVAMLRPRSLEALRGIKGLGEKKIAAYGPEILSIVGRFEEAAREKSVLRE